MADHDNVLAPSFAAIGIEVVLQADKGQHLATQIDVIATLGIGQCTLGQFNALDHHIEGNDVVGVADSHQEAVDDGKGERQADLHTGSFSRDAVQIDRAAQGSDVAFDDIHAHPATGEVGYRLGGREPRLEDQVVYLLIRQRGGWADQTALDGFLLDPGFVETSSIIPNFDDDTVGVVIGIEIQGATGGICLPAAVALPIQCHDPSSF